MPVGNILQKLHLRLVAHSRPFSQSEEEEEERTLEDDDEEEAPDIVMTWNMAKYLPEDGSIQVGRHKHVQEAGAGLWIRIHFFCRSGSGCFSQCGSGFS